jgi:Na+/melibiose symporter-like transporter
VLSVVSVSSLVWATIEAPSHGWGSATTLRSFAIAIVLLACFVTWELRCAHPMLELRFFRNPRFSVANLASSTASFTFAGSLFVFTQLLQFVFGYSPLRAGLALIPFSVAFIVGGLIGPRLAERVGTHRGVALGLVIFAGGLCLIAFPSSHPTYTWIGIAMFAMGVGPGLLHAPTTDAAVGSVHREQAGVAAGTNSTGRQVATALGVAIMGSLLVSGYRSALAGHTSKLSEHQLADARASVGGAREVAHRLGGVAGRALDDAARSAFDHGMRLSFSLGAVLLVMVAGLALRFLPAHAREQLDVDGAVELAALDAAIID